MTKKEMWEKFLNSKGGSCGVAIHCNTEEKANRLLKYLHKKGFKWRSGNDLTLKNEYHFFGNETCYTCAVGVRSKETIEHFFKEYILEFDDIKKYIKKKKEVNLKKYSKTYKDFNENVCEKIRYGCRTCKLSCDNNEIGCGCRNLLIEYPYTAYKLMKKMLKEYKEENE